MFRFSTHTILLAVAVGAGVAALGSRASGEEPRVSSGLQATGEDFRVDNAVFTGERKEPISQSVTIFHEGIVYDCMKKPAEVVVFDKMMKRFTLLNLENGTRAELTTRDVAEFLDRFETRLKEMVKKRREELVQFMAEPKFEEKYDEQTRHLTLSSKLVNYSLELSQGVSPTAATQYREFSDWYVRLNLLLTPGSLPPFARMAVNAAVAKHKSIASQVTLTITSPKDGRKREIRSIHRIVRPLTQADLSEVARIGKAMSEFRAIDFEKYRKGEVK